MQPLTRALALGIAAAAVVSPASLAAQSSDRGGTGSTSADDRASRTGASEKVVVDGEEGKEADSKEQSSGVENEDGESPTFDLARPPHPYSVAVQASGTALFWRNAAQEVDLAWMGGASGHFRLFGPLFGSLSLGYARRADNAGSIQTANTHVNALIGAGAELWVQSVRAGLQIQAGALYRQISHRDGAGNVYTSGRIRPAVGARFAVGNAFFDRLLVSVLNGARFYPPTRLEFYTGLEVGWLF